ncbi:UNVERIFIED_CONTAM: hypothetical protein GTU68_026491 [Idotea baltica]|nr:hypothetical protein [Idotea baltica]
MSDLAREYGAINLSQGFPDFQCDPLLPELVAKYMKEGLNQYAPSIGIPQLREQISKMVLELYGNTYDADQEITITSGATEALYCAISSVVNEGDEVILFEPAYDSYVPVIELNGGRPVFVSLEAPDYKVNWENLKKRINSRTRVIMLNSPHNPTGVILSDQDMLELQKIVKSNNIFVISDEVYEHIIFDGADHQSVARYPDLATQSFVISSFGKTFHTTGWKVGYCLAPEALSKEFRKIHQFLTFSTSTPFQYAIAEYMQDRQRITGLKDFYQAKRDFFQAAIAGSKFKILPCLGTYFQLLDYSEISDMPDMEFAEWLVREHKLAAIPLSPFFQRSNNDRILRFCFAKEDETLEAAAKILNQL